MSKTHSLKIWPQWYDEIESSRKTFEIRNGADRCFQAGDTLMLQKWDPERREFVQGSAPLYVRVMGVFHQPGLAPGYVAMSIRKEADLSGTLSQSSGGG